MQKNKIKRKKVYKKWKNKEKTDYTDNVNESGYYSEIDNNLIQLQNLNSEKDLSSELSNKEEEKKIKFGDLKFELDDKYKHLINGLRNLKYKNNAVNHITNNEYITFGSLNIKINNIDGIDESNGGNTYTFANTSYNSFEFNDKRKKVYDNFLKNKKRFFTKIKILIYFKNLYFNIKNRKNNINQKDLTNYEIKKEKFLLNDNYNSFLKEYEFKINSEFIQYFYIFDLLSL